MHTETERIKRKLVAATIAAVNSNELRLADSAQSELHAALGGRLCYLKQQERSRISKKKLLNLADHIGSILRGFSNHSARPSPGARLVLRRRAVQSVLNESDVRMIFEHEEDCMVKPISPTTEYRASELPLELKSVVLDESLVEIELFLRSNLIATTYLNEFETGATVAWPTERNTKITNLVYDFLDLAGVADQPKGGVSVQAWFGELPFEMNFSEDIHSPEVRRGIANVFKSKGDLPDLFQLNVGDCSLEVLMDEVKKKPVRAALFFNKVSEIDAMEFFAAYHESKMVKQRYSGSSLSNTILKQRDASMIFGKLAQD